MNKHLLTGTLITVLLTGCAASNTEVQYIAPSITPIVTCEPEVVEKQLVHDDPIVLQNVCEIQSQTLIRVNAPYERVKTLQVNGTIPQCLYTDDNCCYLTVNMSDTYSLSSTDIVWEPYTLQEYVHPGDVVFFDDNIFLLTDKEVDWNGNINNDTLRVFVLLPICVEEGFDLAQWFTDHEFTLTAHRWYDGREIINNYRIEEWTSPVAKQLLENGEYILAIGLHSQIPFTDDELGDTKMFSPRVEIDDTFTELVKD